MEIFNSRLIFLKSFLTKLLFNINMMVYKTTAIPKTIEIKNNKGFKILVKYGKMKKNIASNAKIRENIVAFLIPIRIANVLTPSFLSPSISSQPLITSRESKRKNDVKKKKYIYGGTFELFKTAP